MPGTSSLLSSSGLPPRSPRTPTGSLVSDDGLSVNNGDFPCSHCEKRFGNRRNLLSHMRRHTGDFKLFCESCGKGFFTQSKLDSHKRKHTGNSDGGDRVTKNIKSFFCDNFI